MPDPKPEWSRDPDKLEEIFHAALQQGDAKGVEAALTLMSGCDPRRAARLFDDLKTALAVAPLLSTNEPALLPIEPVEEKPCPA